MFKNRVKVCDKISRASVFQQNCKLVRKCQNHVRPMCKCKSDTVNQNKPNNNTFNIVQQARYFSLSSYKRNVSHHMRFFQDDKIVQSILSLPAEGQQVMQWMCMLHNPSCPQQQDLGVLFFTLERLYASYAMNEGAMQTLTLPFVLQLLLDQNLLVKHVVVTSSVQQHEEEANFENLQEEEQQQKQQGLTRLETYSIPNFSDSILSKLFSSQDILEDFSNLVDSLSDTWQFLQQSQQQQQHQHPLSQENKRILLLAQQASRKLFLTAAKKLLFQFDRLISFTEIHISLHKRRVTLFMQAAELAHQLKEWSSEINFYELAIPSALEMFNGDSTALLADLEQKLGECLLSQSYFVTAQEHIEKAIQIRRKLMTGNTMEEQQSLITCYHSLASLFLYTSQFKKSLNYCDKVLNMVSLQDRYGLLIYSQVLEIKAQVFIAQEEAQLAIEQLNKALMIKNQAIGDQKHTMFTLPHFLPIRLFMASTHLLKQEAKEALKLLEEMEQEFLNEFIIEQAHPIYMDILTRKGAAHVQLKQIEKALESFTQAFKVYKAFSSPDSLLLISPRDPTNADISFAFIELAKLYIETRNYPKALGMLNEAVNRIDDKFGEKHAKHVDALYTLGITFHKLKSNKHAIEVLEKAKMICGEYFGFNHPKMKRINQAMFEVKKEVSLRDDPNNPLKL